MTYSEISIGDNLFASGSRWKICVKVIAKSFGWIKVERYPFDGSDIMNVRASWLFWG